MAAIEKVKEYLQELPYDLKVIEFEESTHTSELAAEALGVEVGQIAKSVLFLIKDTPILVVTSGDAKIINKKIKEATGLTGKVKLVPPGEVEGLTGFSPGGVCPFALKAPLVLLLDKSMERFPVVYAAAGSPHSAVPVTMEQLQEITGGKVCDVCEVNL